MPQSKRIRTKSLFLPGTIEIRCLSRTKRKKMINILCNHLVKTGKRADIHSARKICRVSTNKELRNYIGKFNPKAILKIFGSIRNRI